MAKDKDNDTLFIATAAAVGLFLIFKGKGNAVQGVGKTPRRQDVDEIQRIIYAMMAYSADMDLFDSSVELQTLYNKHMRLLVDGLHELYPRKDISELFEMSEVWNLKETSERVRRDFGKVK